MTAVTRSIVKAPLETQLFWISKLGRQVALGSIQVFVMKLNMQEALLYPLSHYS